MLTHMLFKSTERLTVYAKKIKDFEKRKISQGHDPKHKLTCETCSLIFINDVTHDESS